MKFPTRLFDIPDGFRLLLFLNLVKEQLVSPPDVVLKTVLNISLQRALPFAASGT